MPSTNSKVSPNKISNFYTEIQIWEDSMTYFIIAKTQNLSKLINKSFTKKGKTLVNSIQYNPTTPNIYGLIKKHKSDMSMHFTFSRFKKVCHKLSLNRNILTSLRNISSAHAKYPVGLIK